MFFSSFSPFFLFLSLLFLPSLFYFHCPLSFSFLFLFLSVSIFLFFFPFFSFFSYLFFSPYFPFFVLPFSLLPVASSLISCFPPFAFLFPFLLLFSLLLPSLLFRSHVFFSLLFSFFPIVHFSSFFFRFSFYSSYASFNFAFCLRSNTAEHHHFFQLFKIEASKIFVTKGIFGLVKKIFFFLFSWKTAKLDCFVLAVLQNYTKKLTELVYVTVVE